VNYDCLVFKYGILKISRYEVLNILVSNIMAYAWKYWGKPRKMSVKSDS